MKTKNSGFTLIEVLIALIIISVGLVAMVQTGQVSANTLEQAKLRTSAYHVADQVMMLLYRTSGLSIGSHQGEQKFQGQTYYWKATLTRTENISINRIDMVVSTDLKFDYAVAKLTGFKKS